MVCFCLFVSFFGSAQILTESFSYGALPDSLTGATANWSVQSSSLGNKVQYINSGLSSPLGFPTQSGGAATFAGGSGSREDLIRSIGTQNTGSVYAAALVKISSTGADYFFHFFSGSFVARVYTGNSPGKLRFGVSKTATTGSSNLASTLFNYNSIYLMVLKYTFNSGSSTNDIASLWILSEPSATELSAGAALSVDTAGNDASSLTHIAIRQGTSSAVGIIDEIRVATTWEEAIGTNVWNGSAWSLGTPDSNSNVSIAANLSLGNNFSAYKMDIANGKNLTINSNELSLFGLLTGGGLIAGSAASNLDIEGNVGTINFASGSQELHNLNLGKNAIASLGTPLKLCAGSNFGSLILDSLSVLNTNGNLCFASNEDGTARLATVPIGATLNGEISVERYIPATRAFRFVSCPVSTNTGLDDAWQLGTHITGNGPGFDSTGSQTPSLFILNEANQIWVPFNNTQTQNLQQNIGYRILVRGDRSIDLGSSSATPTSTILKAKGQHITGDKIFNTSSNPALSATTNNFSLIGNPFPSSIDWSQITKTDISSTYYIWRAQGGSNNKGAYINYNASGNISSDGNINNLIGSGSAFMVKTIGATPNISIKETDKVSGNQGSFILGKSNGKQLRISIVESDSVLSDALVIYEHAQATSKVDEFDSEKWNNPGLTFYSKDSLGNRFSIQALTDFTLDQTIYFGMDRTEKKAYQMKFDKINFEGKGWHLHDQFTKQEISLETNFNYSFQVSADSLSFWANRFFLRKGQVTTLLGESKPDFTFSIWPQPCSDHIQIGFNHQGVAKIHYEVINMMGQAILKGQIEPNQTIEMQHLSRGMYLLKLSINDKSHIKKFFKL
ncbi:MAG: T9SS type A sorting domain-containing protein [bacterium]|nr:T9SS type A sorting domain-containing protein [bacterium]